MFVSCSSGVRFTGAGGVEPVADLRRKCSGHLQSASPGNQGYGPAHVQESVGREDVVAETGLCQRRQKQTLVQSRAGMEQQHRRPIVEVTDPSVWRAVEVLAALCAHWSERAAVGNVVGEGNMSVHTDRLRRLWIIRCVNTVRSHSLGPQRGRTIPACCVFGEVSVQQNFSIVTAWPFAQTRTDCHPKQQQYSDTPPEAEHPPGVHSSTFCQHYPQYE